MVYFDMFIGGAPSDTKLSSSLSLNVESVFGHGVAGRASLGCRFGGAGEGVLLVGMRMHAAFTWAKSFAFIMWWVRVRCWPNRVMIAPHDLYVH